MNPDLLKKLRPLVVKMTGLQWQPGGEPMFPEARALLAEIDAALAAPTDRDSIRREAFEEAARVFDAKLEAMGEFQDDDTASDEDRAMASVYFSDIRERYVSYAAEIRALAAPVATEATAVPNPGPNDSLRDLFDADRIGWYCEHGDHATCVSKYDGKVIHFGGERVPCSCKCHAKGGADGR